MKVCCGWCYLIYEPKDPKKAAELPEVFCCKGCWEADKLFRRVVELEHEKLKRQRRALY